MNLVEILSGHEGKTLEFKRDLTSPDGILRTIVAFANTSGGRILIGVDDGTKSVRGVQNVLSEEERLASLIADSIAPILIPSIDILAWRKSQLLLIEIHPSPNRPHHLIRLGAEAGVYVRVGSTNRRADKILIDEMKRYSQITSFDEQPVSDLNSEAIDFQAASKFFQPVRKLTRSDLKTLRITTTHQGRVVPTIGGILLFGVNRLDRFPDAWVQAGRFAGKDKRKIVDSTEIRSPLLRIPEDALAFVRKHSSREALIGAVKRTDVWTLPPVALREALINAVVHADYAQRGAPIRIALFDDRLEIENPGLLPFGLTVEDIRQGISKLRNRVIGRVFQELGLVEQWGSGIQRMTAACLDSGLDAPRFEEIATHFRVTLSTVRKRSPEHNANERKILAALAASGSSGLSTSGIAGKLRISPRAARNRLASLVERGSVAEIASGPKDPRRRYFLIKTEANL